MYDDLGVKWQGKAMLSGYRKITGKNDWERHLFTLQVLGASYDCHIDDATQAAEYQKHLHKMVEVVGEFEQSQNMIRMKLNSIKPVNSK